MMLFVFTTIDCWNVAFIRRLFVSCNMIFEGAFSLYLLVSNADVRMAPTTYNKSSRSRFQDRFFKYMSNGCQRSNGRIRVGLIYGIHNSSRRIWQLFSSWSTVFWLDCYLCRVNSLLNTCWKLQRTHKYKSVFPHMTSNLISHLVLACSVT